MYQNKRVFITGATGFIGRHLLSALALSEAQVTIAVREPSSFPQVRHVCVGDVRDQEFMSTAIDACSPHIIFHLAGARDRVLSHAAFGQAFEANLTGTLNVLFAARQAPVLERIVVLGTAEEYGGNVAPFRESMRELPISAYSFSKQCATHLSQMMHANLGLPVTILRPSVAYGPGQRSDMFLPDLIQTLLRGEPFSMTPGEQTRDYVYVQDLVEALLRAGCRADINGEIINIGSGAPVRMAALVDRIEALLGREGWVRRGALDYRPGEPMAYWLDISKARQLLEWVPGTSLDEGLQRTVAWYRGRHE